MQKFEFTIIRTSRVLHVSVDYLSRIETGNAAIGVPVDIPDGDILTQEVVEEDQRTRRAGRYKEIEYFLTQGIPPPSLKRDQRKKFTLRSQRFSIIHDALYNQGADAAWSMRSLPSSRKLTKEWRAGTTQVR